MKDKIETFISLITASGHEISELGFSSGASSKEINNIEQVTGQKLPDELKLFLTIINGQETDDFYFLPDQTILLSCDGIIEEWQQGQEYADDTDEFYNEFQCDDKIRCTIYHKTRIPFACQEGAGILCIDNDPGPNGKVGQIIYLIDECSFIVLADSFKEFIELYVDRMQKGILKFENEKEGYPNKYRLKSEAKEMNGTAFEKIFQN